LILDRFFEAEDIFFDSLAPESGSAAVRGDSRMRRIGTALAIAAMLGLGGCAGLDTTDQRVLTGAAIGAGVGATIGIAAGVASGGVVDGAVGAVVGAAVGAGVGYVVDQVSD
jgi:osmotically inducible lipoprotein OsmB